MTVTIARDTISCPGCGRHRVVTGRQRRRHASRAAGILCAACRGIPTQRSHTDADLRFWLNKFGANCCPPGVTARALAASGGIPPELAELAKAVFKP